MRRPINEAAVRQIFDKLQFRTLLDRVLKVAAAAGDQISTLPVQTLTTTDDGSVPAVVPGVRTMVDEDLAKWIGIASDRGMVPLGVRIEFGQDGITGFGLASGEDSVYVPWAPGRKDYTALQDWLASDAPKYLFDSKRSFKAMHRAGLELDGIAFDTTLAAWLVKPGGNTENLAAQVYAFLGATLPQSDPNQLIPDTEPVSVATEAWYVLQLADELAGRLDAGSRRVLDEIELPLVPVLAGMELSGVTVNADVLGGLSAELAIRAGDLASAAYAEIGHEVNLGSPKQLQQVLFEELGMPKTRSTKTGYSTDAASLADLQASSPHPFLGMLLEHRDVTKLRQMIETLEKAIGPDHRVHTRYDQTGTSTGRISSNDPNLQNIPVRTEEGRRIRTAFECGPEFATLLTADYSQIEMRIMAHLSGDAGLIEAFNSGEDLHRFVGARIFGVEPSAVTSSMRSKVKAMSYGLAYGLSAFGLSKQLRIDTAEAKQLMSDYFLRFGAVRDYLRGVVAQAREDGYTETIFGRRRPFADLNSSNRVLRENAERAALNAPIQGSAADILKIAMLDIARDIRGQKLGSRMLLQVHDELIFEVVDGELEALTAIVKNRMSHAADLKVPLDVQIGTGPNWDAAAH